MEINKNAIDKIVLNDPCKKKNFFISLKNKIRAYLSSNKHVLLLLYFPLYLIVFFCLEKHADISDYWVSYLPIDDSIPFIKEFVIPYLFWFLYLFGYIFYCLIKDIYTFKKLMYFIIVSFTIGLITFIILPTAQNLRPEHIEGNDICAGIMLWLYSADTNTNVMPSMHVVGTLAVVFSVLKSSKGNYFKLLLVLLSIPIIASTVLIKQHSILDVFTAVVLCLAVYYVVYALKAGMLIKKGKIYCHAFLDKFFSGSGRRSNIDLPHKKTESPLPKN